MEEQISREEIIKKLSEFALDLRNEDKSDEEIKAFLLEKNVDEETIRLVMGMITTSNERVVPIEDEDEGSGAKGWIVWIAVLIGINVLSAIFDWGFWVY